jgi:ComF family protein
VIIQQLIEFITPGECLNCGKEGALLCQNCLPVSIITKRPTCYRCNKLSETGKTCSSCRSSSKLAGVTVASHYDGAIKELITALKYGHQRSAATISANLITPLLSTEDFDVVTAVPTSPQRRRGYNQAALIAKAVARDLCLPYRETLARTRNIHQVGAARQQRLEQVKGIFRSTKDVFGQRVLIIDDVLTTGATMAECARELKTAGAKRVWGAVVAKH